MARIEILDVVSDGTSATISWKHDIKSANVFNIVCDNNGSCNTIGVSSKDTSTVINNLVPGQTYIFTVLALTKSTWTKSEPKTITL